MEPSQKQIKEPKIKSSLRLKSKTALGKEQIHKISTILLHLINHNDSTEFRQAVDWRGLELLDYPEIIKNPMDLGTVNQKFKQKKYKTVQQVLNDIQLIWDNCKLYNQKESEFYELADKLELSFRRMVKNYLPKLKVATVTSSPIRPITQPPFTITYKPVREQTKPTLESKQNFMYKIALLSQDELHRVISSIKQSSPKSLVEAQNGWGKINVESMNSSLVAKLCSLMAELLSANKSEDES